MIIGEVFITSWVAGLVIALIIWGIMTLVAYFQGDNILLSVAGAKKYRLRTTSSSMMLSKR